MTDILRFPEGFSWGTATSSYQVEGAVHDDGRGESIWDRFCATPGKIMDGSSGDAACEHYRRFAEDVALMKELGMRAYRFSVAWPRIVPTGSGRIEPRGLDFYDKLVDALLAAGITPYPTLYHWDLPQPLEDAGGWPARATAQRFAEYADAVSRRLGDRVRHWITHNEPWCISHLGYRLGLHAPGRKDWRAALEASHHVLLSHGLAVPVLRGNSPGAEVGIALNLCPAMPASPSQADHDAARFFDGDFNRWFLDPLHGRGYPSDMIAHHVADGHLPSDGLAVVRPGDPEIIATACDFLGVNYYRRGVCRSERISEEENQPPTVHLAPSSEWTSIGWEVYPDGLYDLLLRVHRDYALSKLLVTESGAAYPTAPDGSGRVPDVKRAHFLRDHFAAAHRAIRDGVPLAGYFVWSLLDNFEWAHGYEQRFGIVWVDYPTQRRIPKDSALYYRKVAQQNAVEVGEEG